MGIFDRARLTIAIGCARSLFQIATGVMVLRRTRFRSEGSQPA